MKEIKSLVEKNFDKAKDFLTEIIKFKSVSGEGEEKVGTFLYEKFSEFGEVNLVPISDDLKKDPEYAFGKTEFDYSKRKNMVLRFSPKGTGKSLILNSHMDVVSAENWQEAYSPKTEGDYLYGRGACDAKGQVASIYLALCVLKDLRVKLQGELIVEIVIEEEVGGNGALALIRQGYKADGVIVLEPTELEIKPANRGAIWFQIEIEGKPVHMGKIWKGVNAIEKTCYLMKVLREYEKKLIEESKNIPLFEKYKQPVQLNFGVIQGEGWPSMVCGKVILEGGVGFLPNKTLEQVKKELKDAIENCGDEWIKNHYKLSFNKLHNDSYTIGKDHPLVKVMEKAAEDSFLSSDVNGWIVSCDARLFAKVGKMPVVVFGPGSLDDAHSNHEKIELNQMKIASEVVTRAVINWCGRE